MNKMKTLNLNTQKYYLFVDTETIGSLYYTDSVVPFDISVKVYDYETKQVVKQRCYLIKRFIKNKFIMLSSFSAGKYPQYLKRAEENPKDYKMVSIQEFSKNLTAIIKKYNIKTMVAHNGEFDYNVTNRLGEEFEVNSPLAKLDVLDTMEISKPITFHKQYINFCIKNKDIKNGMGESKFITNSGRVRTTAEALHCFIIKDPYYTEEHTGLEDIDIEIDIFEKSLLYNAGGYVQLNTRPKWTDYIKVIE